MKLDEIKQGLNSLLDSVTEGWHRLRESAASSLTRFKPTETANLPAKDAVDDDFYLPSHSWSMIGGDVFEDDKRVVVRLEVPGLEKQDFDIAIEGDVLVVSGEKRFERESSEGRYRLLQCAYGSFRRVVSLPTAVLVDQAVASYKNGVLRIELPKAEVEAPRRRTIPVE